MDKAESIKETAKAPRKARQTKAPTYEEAVGELENIVSEMRGGNCDITALAAKVRRASELLKYCRSILTTTEKELNEALGELTGDI